MRHEGPVRNEKGLADVGRSLPIGGAVAAIRPEMIEREASHAERKRPAPQRLATPQADDEGQIYDVKDAVMQGEEARGLSLELRRGLDRAVVDGEARGREMAEAEDAEEVGDADDHALRPAPRE